MKKLALMITLLVMSVYSYSQEKLYKEFGKTQILTNSEYSMLKQIKLKKLRGADAGMKLKSNMVIQLFLYQ